MSKKEKIHYFSFPNISRSSRPEVFCKKGVLRNFAKFIGKHQCQSLFLNKVAGLKPATLLKKRLWHRCFPVYFTKFLRTPFFTEHLWATGSEYQWFNPSIPKECTAQKKSFPLRISSVNKHNPTYGMCYCGTRYVLFLLQLIWPRRFYLAGDFFLTNLFSFIQDSLEWPFSELFFSDVLLWKWYRYIAFNIFSCRILIISYKMLIFTGISNEIRNKLTMYAILCWNVAIFYRHELVCSFLVQEKLEMCRNSKWTFSSCFNCFSCSN